MFILLVLFIFSQFQEEHACFLFRGKMDALALLYFVKICGLCVRKRGVCGYGYIQGYPWKSVNMDMDMDMDRKFHIHGKPGKLSYPSLILKRFSDTFQLKSDYSRV